MKKNVFEICLAIFCIGLILQIIFMTKKIDSTLSLIFGPILFLAYKNQQGKSIPLKQVILHFIPFIVVTIFYFLIRKSNEPLFRHIYFITTLLSMFIYPSIVIFSKRKSKSILNEGNLILLEILAILGFAIFFFLNIIYINQLSNNFLNLQAQLVIVAIMLINIGVLAWFLLSSRFIKNNESAASKGFYKNIEYPISDIEIKQIQIKIENVMDEKKVFLDAHLSLDRFAKQIGIPKDKVDFFITNILNSNYEDWLASYRIKYAISLLHTNKGDLKLEYLANLSGFNSRTAFNKYFKYYVGESPSNYRNKLIK